MKLKKNIRGLVGNTINYNAGGLTKKIVFTDDNTL